MLVLGSGISGLLHVHLASVSGAGFIAATDLSGFRLEAAKKFGANQVINAKQDVPELFRQHNQGKGADLVIICASAQSAFEQAFQAVARGGTILVFAPTHDGVKIPLNINEAFWRRDLTITTTYAGSPADCAAALGLISSGRVKVGEMVTHKFGLENTVLGSKMVAEAQNSIKIIIRPQE